MKVIIAQGNPGNQYTGTRHNVGFEVLDACAAAKQVVFAYKPKFFADIAEYIEGEDKIVFVKPHTFYNETGRVARSLLDFYKLNPASDILVVHDDLALPFGTLRTREKGSDAGNNGIKSLNAHIGPDYARLRIGIFNELRERMNDADFVLSRFNVDETATLKEIIMPKCMELIEHFITDTHQNTSHSL